MRLKRLYADHGSLLIAAATVGSVTIFGKVLGAGKEVLVAKAFGTSAGIDAYLIALLIPTFLASVLGGSINSALMPAFVSEHRRGGEEAARKLLSETTLYVLALMLLSTVLICMSADSIAMMLGPSLGREEAALTVRLTIILSPITVAAGLSVVWSCALVAVGKSIFAGVSSVTVPVAAGIATLMGSDRWGIYALAVGTLMGYVADAMIMLRALGANGLRPSLRFERAGQAAVHVFGQAKPVVIGTLLMGLNPVIDQAVAAILGPGNVAALGYGSKVVSLAMGVGSISLTSAIFPYLSALVADGQWDTLRQRLRTYGTTIFCLAAGVTVLAVVYSPAIVRLLFERGAFTPTDSSVVSDVQRAYLLQVPFHLTGMLFVRFISAAGKNKALMWLSLAAAGVNALGDYYLGRLVGAAGIALATSVVYAVTFLAAVLVSRNILAAAPRNYAGIRA